MFISVDIQILLLDTLKAALKQEGIASILRTHGTAPILFIQHNGYSVGQIWCGTRSITLCVIPGKGHSIPITHPNITELVVQWAKEMCDETDATTSSSRTRQSS